MSFKARRLAGTVLIVSLFIQMQIAANGYASRGTKIAFTCVGVDGNRDICVMDGDGGNEVRLTDDPAWDQGPSWSPDGTRIVFYRGHHIYVMDSDGQNLMELTGPLGGTDPAWSPDGAKIAFTRFKALKNQIWVMDADGGNEVQLTQWGENYNPSWSPDGQWIAFDSYRNKVYHIYVVKTDGSGRTSRLTRRRQDHSHPAWSPDGDTIAYTIREPGGFRTINLMARNGRHLKQLSKADFYSADPDWFDPTAWSVSPVASFVTIWGEIKAPPAGRR